jgi:hypothetical protein
MKLCTVIVFLLSACLVCSTDSPTHGQSTSEEIINACLAARESELGRYHAEFEFSAKFFGENSSLKRLLLEGSFLSIVKRDGQQVWFGGYAGRRLQCVYTVRDKVAFIFAPMHNIAKRLRSLDFSPNSAMCRYFVDPLSLGIFETNREPITIEGVRGAMFPAAGTSDVTLTRSDRQANNVWVITATDDYGTCELVIDQADFRLLQRIVTVPKSNLRFVTESEYTERFSVRSIPTTVRLREYLHDEVVFESTVEMTAFDPNPIFAADDFGLPALGLPPGSDYLDETTERFVKWNGSETISPDLASHPLVNRDLIARKAAEEAKRNGWMDQYPLVAIAGIGVLAASLLIYRQWRKNGSN